MANEQVKRERPFLHRTFIGLWPGPSLQQELHAQAELCRKHAGGRAPPAQNLHLTLVFLGNLAESQVEAVRTVVSAVEYAPVTLLLDLFGYWRRPQIVWLGSTKPPAELFAYQKRLAKRLREFGFSFEERVYKPHITLLRKARRAPGFEPKPLLWQASRPVVARSVSTTAGVKYRLLAAVQRGSAESGLQP